MGNPKDQRDNAAALSHQRLVATPFAIERHVAFCKVCKLPAEVRSEVNSMIADGETNATIVSALESLGYPHFSVDNILTHKSMFKYVADEATIAKVVAKVNGDEGLRQQYLSDYETEVVEIFNEVQKCKNRELMKLWGEAIPAVRDQVLQINKNAMLPIKDYASAYDILLKDALLLEGKPTGRLYVEQHASNMGGNTLKGIDKLCEIVGVTFENELKNDSKSEA